MIKKKIEARLEAEVGVPQGHPPPPVHPFWGLWKTSPCPHSLGDFQERSLGLRGPFLPLPSRLFLKVIQAVLTEGAPERQRLPPLPSRHHARSGCGVSLIHFPSLLQMESCLKGGGSDTPQ